MARRRQAVTRRRGLALIVSLFLAPALHSAEGHELRIITSVKGATITGTVSFAGGIPAADAVVQVMGPDREILGQVGVDSEGHFAYEARYRMDYTLRARTADLHAVEAIVSKDQFSEDLPLFTVDPKIRKLFEQAVEEQKADELSSEIRQLRQQVDQLESSIGLRDVVGGIGFIVGILGLLVFWRQRLQ